MEKLQTYVVSPNSLQKNKIQPKLQHRSDRRSQQHHFASSLFSRKVKLNQWYGIFFSSGKTRPHTRAKLNRA